MEQKLGAAAMMLKSMVPFVVGVLGVVMAATAQSGGQPREGAAPEAKQGPAAREETVVVVMRVRYPDAEASKRPRQAGQPAPTREGEIVLELNKAKAPVTVENFLGYMERGDYNGTIFHRVIPNFMIQGGGFTEDMKKKPAQKPIKNEWKNGLKNERGMIAMARIGGMPDSASNQFFINLRNNAPLDDPKMGGDGAAYAVFGRVVKGMEIVDAISAVKTGVKGGHEDVPVEPVLIEEVREATPEEAEAVRGGSAGEGEQAGQ